MPPLTGLLKVPDSQNEFFVNRKILTNGNILSAHYCVSHFSHIQFIRTMAGEKNLERLLKNMSPRLNQGDYVFCPVSKDFDAGSEEIIGSFTEEEGKTLVINKVVADRLNLPYGSLMSWITLNVHSSLEAVGLTAKVSGALAEKGISCNVVAAYYHDHIFVGKEDAQKALNTLLELS